MEDEDVLVNVADGRCPTLNDLYAEIKRLEKENFQLRVRIYINEQQQNGGCTNKFDPHSKNGLAEEYFQMKKQKEDAEEKCAAIKAQKDELELKILDHKSSVTTSTVQAHGDNNNKATEERINNMTRALVDLGAKCAKLETEKKQQTECIEELRNQVQTYMDALRSCQSQLRVEQSRLAEVNEKLRLSEEAKERLEKEAELSTAQGLVEKQMKDRQIQVQSQQMSNLLVDNQILVERLGVSEEALKQLHHEHSKLVVELRNLKASYTAHVLSASRSNEMPVINGEKCDTTRQDTSPDLGIESGQDVSSNENNVYAENAMLRNYNRQLVLKLQQTRQALDKTVNRLSTTTKHKEQVEKAVCRQLHKTHSILKEAKQSLEKKQSQQVLTDLLPSSV